LAQFDPLTALCSGEHALGANYIDSSVTREATMVFFRALLTLSSFSFVLMADGSQAQSIPPEGPLSVTYTATQTMPAKPMSIGGRREFVVLNMAMTASNDTGNPVLNNMVGRCQLTRLMDASVNSVETHGFCTYVDNGGDQIFEQCDFLPGAPNNCKLTGGTGKFEGLEASIVITSMPLKGNYDNIAQAIGHKKGTYKIVKTQ
jgi:hypothetical protein